MRLKSTITSAAMSLVSRLLMVGEPAPKRLLSSLYVRRQLPSSSRSICLFSVSIFTFLGDSLTHSIGFISDPTSVLGSTKGKMR